MIVPTVLDGGSLPGYARPGDAGADLTITEACVLAPGERRLVGTGVRVAIPAGHVGLITPRSGLAAKHCVTVLNAPGIIDAGYRGEIKVILHNTSTSRVNFRCGDRIAQLVITPVETPRIRKVVNFTDTTERGGNGFGSTGR